MFIVSNGTFAENCRVVVRMRVDFDLLPFGPDVPATAPVNLQLETWHGIGQGVVRLFDVCLRGRGLPGWTSISENIVVAYWPGDSLMNEYYGVNAARNLKISNPPILAFDMAAETYANSE